MARMKTREPYDPDKVYQCTRCSTVLVPGKAPNGTIAPSRLKRLELTCRACERKRRKEREAFNAELEAISDRYRRECEAELRTPEAAAARRKHREAIAAEERRATFAWARQMWPGEVLTLSEIHRRQEAISSGAIYDPSRYISKASK